MELFYKKYAEKIKQMRPHCAKCKKCARTASNAIKCGTCGKTQKVQDFCAAHNCIFPQGVVCYRFVVMLYTKVKKKSSENLV